MSEQKLAAEVRTEFGKGFARRARMANLIPAVIYGHGAEPIHITLPAKATTLAVRKANALLTLDINGEKHLALVKDIQRDPIKQRQPTCPPPSRSTSKAAPPASTSTLPTLSCRRVRSCWPTPTHWWSTSPRPQRLLRKRHRLTPQPQSQPSNNGTV